MSALSLDICLSHDDVPFTDWHWIRHRYYERTDDIDTGPVRYCVRDPVGSTKFAQRIARLLVISKQCRHVNNHLLTWPEHEQHLIQHRSDGNHLPSRSSTIREDLGVDHSAKDVQNHLSTHAECGQPLKLICRVRKASESSIDP